MVSNHAQFFSVHLALVLCQASYSVWALIASFAFKNGGYNSLLFCLYREFLGSTIMLIPIAFRRIPMNVRVDDRMKFVWIGFCSFATMVGALTGIQLSSPSRFSIMQPIIPIIACLISVLCKLEVLNIFKTLGVVSGVVGGVLMTVFSKRNLSEKNATVGTLLILFQCFGSANLVVFIKILISRYDYAFIAFSYYFIGTLFTFIFVAFYTLPYMNYNDLTFKYHLIPWLALLYAAFFVSTVTNSALTWVGKYTVPSVQTLYITLQPVITISLSYIFFGYQLNLSHVFGGMLVIIGLLLTVYGKDKDIDNLSDLEDSSHNDYTETVTKCETTVEYGGERVAGEEALKNPYSVPFYQRVGIVDDNDLIQQEPLGS